MVVIRLSRVGKKNSPSYRVVVADKRRAVKRKHIEIIGHYNPTLKPKKLVINSERALFWMAQGAQASDTVRNLMADLGIIKKSEKINKVYGKPTKKKAVPEEQAPAAAATQEAAPEENGEETSVAEESAEELDANVESEAASNDAEAGEEIPAAE